MHYVYFTYTGIYVICTYSHRHDIYNIHEMEIIQNFNLLHIHKVEYYIAIKTDTLLHT